jgi:flagellar basal body-associated protein FliL
LEMEIFAFLMFSTLARRDRPTKPPFSRSLNFAAALAWFAAASSFGLGGASKRAKRRVSRCALDLSTSNRTDRAEHGQNHSSLRSKARCLLFTLNFAPSSTSLQHHGPSECTADNRTRRL